MATELPRIVQVVLVKTKTPGRTVNAEPHSTATEKRSNILDSHSKTQMYTK